MKNITSHEHVLQFKITLLDISPAIWRRILIPQDCTFWELHVAIQDSMGWLDYHLHEFIIDSEKGSIKIGIPDGELDADLEPLDGHDIRVMGYFLKIGDKAYYEYDFGDNWGHEILFEGILLKEAGEAYPKCIAGKRACPPEDSHGACGYEDLLNILADPRHEEFEERNRWLKEHAKNYYPFDPEKFDPLEVVFDDPDQR